MASQSFGPSVTTSSGSTLTLYYDSIEVAGDGASARITNPRAQFTYKSGWSDSTNSFSTIGTNAVAAASHGSQSLSGGATKTFYATPNWVALSYNGETTVQYTFRVSNVSFFTGDSSTRDYTMNINLPRRVSTVGSLNSISTFDMGATVPISWTRPDPNSTITVSVVFGGWMTTLVNRTTATSTNWASSLATLAERVPNATSGIGTVYVDYFDINGNFVGAATQQFTANVPSSVVPTAGTLSVAEGNAAVVTAFGTATNTFIQNKSQVKGTTGTGGAGVHGSTITKTELLINGSVAATFSGHGAGATATTPVITNGSDISIVKRVTDSRGRTASTSAITGTIRPYSAPSITSLEAFRSNSSGAPSGSSTQVTVQLGASVSSLLNGSTQKNTLKYVVKYKLATGGTYTTEFTSALPAGTLTTSPTGNGRRIIPSAVVFDVGSVYDIQVEVTDVFGGTPQTKNAVVSTEIVPLSISATGIGVGKVWQQGAIDAQGDVFVEGSVSVDGSTAVGDYSSLNKVRYIRDFAAGNSANNSSHWVEIQALEGATNRALDRPVTCNSGVTTNIARVTDGISSNSEMYFDAAPSAAHPVGVYVTVDLGALYPIDTIKVWHYYTGGRTYRGTKTQVSADGIIWRTIFDSDVSGTYVETSAGKTITVPQISLANGESYSQSHVYEGGVRLSDTYARRGGMIFGHVGRTTGFHNGNGVWGVVAMEAVPGSLQGGMTFDGSSPNWALVVPKSGWYRVNMQAYFTGAAGYYAARLHVNGAHMDFSIGQYKNAGNDEVLGHTTIRYLRKGDKVNFWFTSTGTNATWGTNYYNGSWFELEYVSDNPA